MMTDEFERYATAVHVTAFVLPMKAVLDCAQTLSVNTDNTTGNTASKFRSLSVWFCVVSAGVETSFFLRACWLWSVLSWTEAFFIARRKCMISKVNENEKTCILMSLLS